MLNLRLLYTLLDSGSIRVYLGLVSVLGFGVLLDVLIFLNLSMLIGPWITMAFLAGSTALGILAMYSLVQSKESHLLESIDGGRFADDLFFRYISTLVAAAFIIMPGIVSTLFGGLLLTPPVAVRVGSVLTGLTGIDWREAYEYLRLDRMTRKDAQS